MNKRYLIAFLVVAGSVGLYFAFKRRQSSPEKIISKLDALLKRKYGDDYLAAETNVTITK
ncbi:MAG: hypothetical protein ACXVJE_19385 [Mucilaginibacter sp.]